MTAWNKTVDPRKSIDESLVNNQTLTVDKVMWLR